MIGTTVTTAGEMQTGCRIAPHPRAIPIGWQISAVCEFDEQVGVAALRRTPAHEMLATQFVQRRHERRPPHNSCAVFRDHLIARAVAADHERVAPLLGRPT
jgi:hypothetical protein